jgi:hypothetical protein
MNGHREEIAPAVWKSVLGYVNFSTGRPDVRFRRCLADLYARLALPDPSGTSSCSLADLQQHSLAVLQDLKKESSIFRDASQAEAVIPMALGTLPRAYRRHHQDLLFHLSDAELFQPFLLARMFEAVLRQGGPWNETERIVQGALQELNDYVGYRPVPVLETRWAGEIYDGERVCPIPLYFRGVGTAPGRYQPLVHQALEVLQQTASTYLEEAGLDLGLLDELAIDPRAYDHAHPANRRPNYVFGEWDPHRLDSQGRYRRFVVRQVLLDGLGCYVREEAQASGRGDDELLREAATVLAGTILMASAMTGSGPSFYDSSTTLARLVPRIASLRDRFYSSWLERTSGAAGERLREQARQLHQPFGKARQFLNHYLATQRADQLQRRRLAILFASMGYPEHSRQQAQAIPTASARILCEIVIGLTHGMRLAEQGRIEEAAGVIPHVEDLLRRGIRCGAVVDPWSVLGFQGQFPLSAAPEDSIADPRIEELIRIVELVFLLYARLLGEAAATGQLDVRARLSPRLKEFAQWWDQFGTWEVGSVHRVHGGEARESAEHVAAALARWRERGAATADLAFWKQHIKAFQTAKAFALVIEALLQRDDLRASMALLMTWLDQAERVPLEDGDYSFYQWAFRWLVQALRGPASLSSSQPVPDWTLVRKFFDYLEANANELWHPPELASAPDRGSVEEDSSQGPYGSAYEGVTYRDSADDGQEGAVAEPTAPVSADFPLEADQQELGTRLRFLALVARLWGLAARQAIRFPIPEAQAAMFASWMDIAWRNWQGLQTFLDNLHAVAVPAPLGSPESMIEYDRRRLVKDQLLDQAIGTLLELALALRSLAAAVRGRAGALPPSWEGELEWQLTASDLEARLLQGAAEEVRELLPRLLHQVRGVALLYVPLDAGGHPRQILRSKLVQSTLRTLVLGLPRIGLLREAFGVLLLARQMEQIQVPGEKRVTEFDRLFEAGLTACVEAVIESASQWGDAGSDGSLVALLEVLTRPFVRLWTEHSQTLRLSTLEAIASESQWQELVSFIRRYGDQLFTAPFLTLSNLRGILHRGVEEYLAYLAAKEEADHASLLAEELDRKISRQKAAELLQIVLRAVAENYDVYRDYNSTTPQSDYGSNLYILLDFLRLRASYERSVWLCRPYAVCHEILARRGQTVAAVLWQRAFAELVRERANELLGKLARLEQHYGVKLRTVADRLGERLTAGLAQDRICALVEPAMHEARTPGPHPSLARLWEEMQPFLAHPTGAGLDVPAWLQRMEWEVHRVRKAHSAVPTSPEDLDRAPLVPMTFEQFQKQLESWDTPLL